MIFDTYSILLFIVIYGIYRYAFRRWQPSWGLKFKAVFKIDKALPFYLSYHEAKKTIRDSILSISFCFFGFPRFNTKTSRWDVFKDVFKHVQHTFPLWCILFRDFTTILHKLSRIFIDNNNQIISGQFI